MQDQGRGGLTAWASSSSNLSNWRLQSSSKGLSRSHTPLFTLAITVLSARPWLEVKKTKHFFYSFKCNFHHSTTTLKFPSCFWNYNTKLSNCNGDLKTSLWATKDKKYQPYTPCSHCTMKGITEVWVWLVLLSLMKPNCLPELLPLPKVFHCLPLCSSDLVINT